MQPKEQFIELIVGINQMKGLDPLTSKVIGILFVEPHEVSLEELSKRTGYSLSAVSTSMKFMRNTGFVKRIKKPGSRKVYFYMEKDLMGSFMDVILQKSQKIMLIMKKKTPEIIESYKKANVPKEELEIIENYYNDLLKIEPIMQKMIIEMKKLK